MSIKKELLDRLTEQELKEIAENKGIKFNLSQTKKDYYEGWDEKDRIVDLMNCEECLTVKEIESYIKSNKA
jgi:signal recognition particle subunit SEC65